MAIVQRLVQQFSNKVVLSGGAHAQAVQRVIRRHFAVGITELDKKLTQLGSREACSDDRTMKRGRDVPDFRPSAFCVDPHERGRIIPPAKQKIACPNPVIWVDD